MKKMICLFVGLLLVISTVMYACRDTSILPLETENAHSIKINICPQDSNTYTIVDRERVKAIVSVINGLDLQEEASYVDPTSDHYYLLEVRISEEAVRISLDEAGISLNHEIYQTDTSDLQMLLEQTYYDVMNRKIH